MVCHGQGSVTRGKTATHEYNDSWLSEHCAPQRAGPSSKGTERGAWLTQPSRAAAFLLARLAIHCATTLTTATRTAKTSASSHVLPVTARHTTADAPQTTSHTATAVVQRTHCRDHHPASRSRLRMPPRLPRNAPNEHRTRSERLQGAPVICLNRVLMAFRSGETLGREGRPDKRAGPREPQIEARGPVLPLRNASPNQTSMRAATASCTHRIVRSVSARPSCNRYVWSAMPIGYPQAAGASTVISHTRGHRTLVPEPYRLFLSVTVEGPQSAEEERQEHGCARSRPRDRCRTFIAHDPVDQQRAPQQRERCVEPAPESKDLHRSGRERMLTSPPGLTHRLRLPADSQFLPWPHFPPVRAVCFIFNRR